MEIIAYSIETDLPSRSFRMTVNEQPVKVVETPAMDAAERQRLSDEYRRLPEYCHIDDPACMHIHYAHLAAEGDVLIRIETNEEIRSSRVHPLRRQIGEHVDGRALSFSTGALDPRYFIVRINELPPLMVVVDHPELEQPAPGDPSVIDAGAFLSDASGSTDQTRNFQHAFAAADGSGKTLYVPAGTYSVTTLHVRNARRFRLYLSAGCVLRVQPSAAGENHHRHGLWLQDLSLIHI